MLKNNLYTSTTLYYNRTLHYIFKITSKYIYYNCFCFSITRIYYVNTHNTKTLLTIVKVKSLHFMFDFFFAKKRPLLKIKRYNLLFSTIRVFQLQNYVLKLFKTISQLIWQSIIAKADAWGQGASFQHDYISLSYCEIALIELFLVIYYL